MLLVADVGNDAHDTGSGHPERPARLGAVRLGITDAVGDDLLRLEPRTATLQELSRVHHPAYLDALETLSVSGGGTLDADTPVSAGSWATARLAAGAGLAAVEAVGSARGGPAFVAVRPPGHHAGPARGMGFCLLNNIAIAATALADAGERVLIVDWDVHHGNGTQEVFWDDPRVLFVSLHQSSLYPGTGARSETGGPGAPGLTVNLPFPPGTQGDAVLDALNGITGSVEAFAPTRVLVSAGYDAHRDDPLANLALSSDDYGRLAERVARFAGGPELLTLFLEGGYDLTALRESVAATLDALRV
jgi:acetoin utilization deacetylase AcuC-like enzyme